MRLLALLSLVIASSAWAGDSTHQVRIELAGAGVFAELPAIGVWNVYPRVAADAAWSPRDKYRAGSTRAVTHLELNKNGVKAFSAQMFMSRDCETELRLNRKVGSPAVRTTIGGWMADVVTVNDLNRVVACRQNGEKSVTMIAVITPPAAVSGLLAGRAVSDADRELVFAALARAFDEPRLFDDRPLAHSGLQAKSANLRLSVDLKNTLILDPAKHGQVFALTNPGKPTVIRVTPFFPSLLLAIDIETAVPGNKNCAVMLEALSKQAGRGRRLVPSTNLPPSYRYRNVMVSDGSSYICADFTGGIQLGITVISGSDIEYAIKSMVPVLEDLHKQIQVQYKVEHKTIATPEPTSTTTTTSSRRRRSKGHDGSIASLLHVSAHNIDDEGGIPDANYAATLDYTYHMRYGSLAGFGMFGHGDIGIGFGTSGGMLYEFQFDPYGLALGSQDFYVGVSPGLGFSGWTGDRLDYAWQAGLRAVASARLGDVRLLASARATAVTGDDRQQGSDTAPIGDEFLAGAHALWQTGESVYGLSFFYREARQSTFIGAAFTLGFASSSR